MEVKENPIGFPQGITAENIITHPSVPRNKLIAENLQQFIARLIKCVINREY